MNTKKQLLMDDSTTDQREIFVSVEVETAGPVPTSAFHLDRRVPFR